ncbi:MAG: hypothetical protein H6559_16235 [Lewinellaceae bacterium]|nr:hypothetical protein [Lewinellaceae bacterium]
MLALRGDKRRGADKQENGSCGPGEVAEGNRILSHQKEDGGQSPRRV